MKTYDFSGYAAFQMPEDFIPEKREGAGEETRKESAWPKKLLPVDCIGIGKVVKAEVGAWNEADEDSDLWIKVCVQLDGPEGCEGKKVSSNRYTVYGEEKNPETNQWEGPKTLRRFFEVLASCGVDPKKMKGQTSVNPAELAAALIGKTCCPRVKAKTATMADGKTIAFSEVVGFRTEAQRAARMQDQRDTWPRAKDVEEAVSESNFPG